MNVLPYCKALDGVRALAALMVVLIHSRLLPVGWVGVQIFFVLSGFLITGILLRQVDRPFPEFMGRFYWRRGLRIWPLYFLFLALCGTAYVFFQIPETWNSAWVWLVSFSYNIARIAPQFNDSDYFGHFWTLCVEEQFYLVWPFVVFLLPRKLFLRFVVFVILCGPLVRYLTGLCLSPYLDDIASIQHSVHGLPTSHLDAFACGALLAVLPAELRRRWAPKARLLLCAVLAVTMAAGLVQSWCLWRGGLPPHWLALGYGSLEHFRQYVWAYSLLNFTSACLIFCALEDAAISRFFSLRPLVFIGTISYGLYLWHLPLLRVVSGFWPAEPHSLNGLARFAVYLAATFAVATLSYFCFERHFLKLKQLSWSAVMKRGQAMPSTTSALNNLDGKPAVSPAQAAPRHGSK